MINGCNKDDLKESAPLLLFKFCVILKALPIIRMIIAIDFFRNQGIWKKQT